MLPSWVAEVIAAGTEDGPALEQAVLELQNSPLVKKVEKIADGSGIYATLWCLAEHKRRGSEQRQFSSTRKTFAACARRLLQLVNERHGAHLAAAEAARAAAALEEAAAAGPSVRAPTAFAAMAAAAHVEPAAAKAKAAETLAAEARAVQRTLEEQLEAAGRAVEAAEAEARRLEAEVRFLNFKPPPARSPAPLPLFSPGLRMLTRTCLEFIEPHAKISPQSAELSANAIEIAIEIAIGS